MISKKTVPLILAVLFGWSILGWSSGPAVAAPQEDPPEEILLDNGFRVTFDGVEYHEDSTSTWFYTLDEAESAKDLHKWVLETPFCAPILDAGPGPWKIVDPDPHAKFSGVQWKTKHQFELGQFWVTLDTTGQAGVTHVGARGSRIAIGEIAGPTCVEQEPPEDPPGDPGDKEPPTIDWVAPVGNGGIYDVQEGETVGLGVSAADNVTVDRVVFLRWDAVKEDYITIAVDDQSPFEAFVSASELNPTWNEVNAASIDTAGNFSGWKWIWLYRDQVGSLFVTKDNFVFAPLLMR